MAGVKETATWENHVYQIEENDPVHGGADGVTNKPIKHLANRTLYLRKLLAEAEQLINPKKITATTKNSNDLTGHTHEIDKASLTTAGLVQLTNDTGLDSEALALTAKGAKALSQRIASLETTTPQKLNTKVDKTSISDAVDSNAQTNVASSKAVKAAYDKGVEALNAANAIKVGGRNLLLNSSNLRYFSFIAESGTVTGNRLDVIDASKNSGIYSFYQTGVDIEPNDTYLLSFDYRTDLPNLNYTYLLSKDDGNLQAVGNYQTISDGNWHRLTARFRSQVLRRNISPLIGAYEPGTGTYLEIKNIKFEKGTVSTEWSPAPEDYVSLAGNETITGSKTFTSEVKAARPRNDSRDNQLVTADWIRTNTANLVDARTAYLGGSIAMQDCKPGQLPQGAFFGIATKNLTGSAQNGFLFFSKPWHDNTANFASVRFGVFGNKFYYQSAKNTNEWNPELELATVPYVDGRFNQLIGAAPAALDTLQELAEALKSNANVLDLYMLKADKSDAVNLDNSNKYATSKAVKTAFDKAVSIENQLPSKVNVKSPSMTGHVSINRKADQKIGEFLGGIHFYHNGGPGSGLGITNYGVNDAYLGIYGIRDSGYCSNFEVWLSKQGNTDFGAVEKAFAISDGGAIWSKGYGWLHDVFMQRTDCSRNWYPNHYAGTEVYKVKHLGLMVVVMNTVSANGEFVLPEAFDGHAICLAQDSGDGRISLEGSRFLWGNKIRLTGRSDTNCHVLVIGSKN